MKTNRILKKLDELNLVRAYAIDINKHIGVFFNHSGK